MIAIAFVLLAWTYLLMMVPSLRPSQDVDVWDIRDWLITVPCMVGVVLLVIGLARLAWSYLP